MKHRYTIRKKKGADEFVVWDIARKKPVGTTMRKAQAQELMQRMNIDARRRGSVERKDLASKAKALRALLRAHGFVPSEARRLLADGVTVEKARLKLLQGDSMGAKKADRVKDSHERQITLPIPRARESLDRYQQELARRVRGAVKRERKSRR